MVEFRSFQVAPDCAWGTSAVAQELYAHAQDLPALKDEEETRIWRLEHPNHGHLFLKEYRLPRRRRWFASRARSRAGRETRGLVAMTAADLPVAPPCFSVERWEGSRLLSSFLVTCSLGQVRPLPVYLAGAGDEGLALCGEVGRLVRRMHDAGFGHFRLQAKNLMVREGRELALLDAPYACRWEAGRLPRRIRALDLSDLGGPTTPLTPAQVNAILSGYREAGDPVPGLKPAARGRFPLKLRRIAYYLHAIWTGHRP